MDIASRGVIGWETADHMRTDLVADALTACRQRRPIRPVIFHSDRGSQYTGQQFATLADRFRIRLSVGRRSSGGSGRWGPTGDWRGTAQVLT
ncbi:DDE-type integrase/transposase/recombinase [Streptomyces sp. NBC_01198]|uniref:DDE-type integrase/transposase/recombinase n=1 Tax=Streptomyces sp. NBC_01198 TaxID=2903769 RepID=UPI003FA3CBF1